LTDRRNDVFDCNTTDLGEHAMKNCTLILICSGLLYACTPSPQSASGFRLPDGDSARGEEAFTMLRCHACHSVDGLELEFLGTGPALVSLGGEVSRVRTYGELVTSIINPSHKLAPGYPTEDISASGESLMVLAYLNDEMTVQQLIDLVAFLQARYEVVVPEIDPYDYLYP
jgi:mono/diheme cytochrome c family protein